MTTEWTDLPTLQDVAKAQADGWEIETNTPVKGYPWKVWDGYQWNSFHIYRARPRQPEMKKVKARCWIDIHTGNLLWSSKDDSQYANWDMWRRFPAGDIEGEVEE